VLDFAAVLGGDFVSVLDTAKLSIRSGGKTETHLARFGSGDSEHSFDVNLKSGDATFTVDVVSTNGTLLYHGSTTQTIDQDGFVVAITPQAVDAVMIVSPRRAVFDTGSTLIGNTLYRTWTATMRIRNAGSANLTWRVDSMVTKPAPVIMGCTDFNDHSCLTNLTRAPGPDLTIAVTFSLAIGFGLPTFTPPTTLRFISSVGNVTTRP
jgi:hypothetical protein